MTASMHSAKMMQPQPLRTSSTESADAMRKRVCKACDRCRLKKSKCDGATPCSRCTADNAICVFGERKKSHDKIYPKGYVEMLEQQQGQLVSGLQQMYHRMLNAGQWEGPVLSEATGHPLTHDILTALGLLEHEDFEDDPEKLKADMVAQGAPLVGRRGSPASEVQTSPQARSSSQSPPVLSRPQPFRSEFSFGVSPSPESHSPAPKQRSMHVATTQSPLQKAVLRPTEAIMRHSDPTLWQPDYLNAWSGFQMHAAQQTPQTNMFMKENYVESPMDTDFSDMNAFSMVNNDFDWNDGGVSQFDQSMDFNFSSLPNVAVA